MSDKKISQLTGATTPLAGTEVLPIVQSGATVKVAVSNLTAGRDITASGATFTKAGVTQVTIENTTGTTKNTQLVFADNVGSKWRVGMDVFTNDGTNELQVYSDTATNAPVRINTSGNLTLPYGNLVIGTAGKGVNFTANAPQAGMTSQLLNWYEEGTFTPTLSGATTTTYTTQTGRYTRVGRLVTFQCELEINLLGDGSTTTFVLGTLPNAGHFSTISIGFFSSVATAVSSLFGYVNSGANSVTMQSTTIAGTSSASNAIFGNSARIIISGQYSV